MQAAEILGYSDRTVRRWRVRYEQRGYDGLFDRRLKRPSPRRVPLKVVEEVLRLYRERYFDFNVRHFHEKLRIRCSRGLDDQRNESRRGGAGARAVRQPDSPLSLNRGALAGWSFTPHPLPRGRLTNVSSAARS
jgi:Helix-turn-helix domain